MNAPIGELPVRRFNLVATLRERRAAALQAELDAALEASQAAMAARSSGVSRLASDVVWWRAAGLVA